MKFRRSFAACARLALFSGALATSLQAIESPPTEMVSAWKLSGGEIIVVFRHDGIYHFIQGQSADPGLERGTFAWDKETGAFSAQTLIDTNGDAGLSDPAGAATLSISGNTMTYTVAGEDSVTFNRIVNTPSAIVGSWLIPGTKISVTFLADNTYYLAEEENDPPFAFVGVEKGTYEWNPTTKAFSASASVDTNGDVGINGIAGVTADIVGNRFVLDDGEEITELHRVVTNPTPIVSPDFGFVRFANFSQSADNALSPRPFDLAMNSYPHSVDAFVYSGVSASNPTVRIGSGTAIPLDAYDDEPGTFEIEEGFTDLSGLNSFLPFSTTVTFASGGSSADITTVASPGTFPSTPKQKLRDGDAWNGSIYEFGEQQVLEWTLPAGFNADQILTVVEIRDPVADEEVYFAELQGDVTFVDIEGRITPGRQYEVQLEFYRIDNTPSSLGGVFSGKTGYGLSASSTRYFISKQPDASNYDNWKSGEFTPEQLADPAISGNDVDFDNDGIDNLLEFVLGGSATMPNRNLLPTGTTTPAPGGRNLVFSYDRKTAANGINQVIETSSTLTGAWTPAVHGANGVTITTAAIDADTQRVTATIPSTQPSLFVRLKATR